ncbi:MAG: hypothetical protein MP439_07255 [Ferrimicrobium sp.]|jgi:hypothetical protein|nr:hypothetical protein [Ferrimicrobium sp.]
MHISHLPSWNLRTLPEFLVIIVVVLIGVRLIFKLAVTFLFLILVVAAGIWVLGAFIVR